MVLLAASCAAPQTLREPPAPPPTAAAADQAGNRLEALAQTGERFCTADGSWCLDADALTYTADGSVRSLEIVDPDQERGVWPFAVFVGPNNDHALFGVTAIERQMFSGGGASSTTLTLYEAVSHSTAVEPVLAVPLESSALVRACFGESDIRDRLEACHDEYSFIAALNLAPDTTSGHPRFVYVAEAATYPGPLSLTEDSSRAAPLRRSDLVWARNDACSFRRIMVLNEDAAHYMPIEPMPDCPDFLRP